MYIEMPSADKGMSAIPESVRKKLAAEYDKAGFMDRYGGDMWLVAIVFTCALLHLFRFQIKNFLHTLKTNWVHNRNNPLYMPIAGHVYHDPGQSPAAATMQNFTASFARIITEVVHIFMIPLLFVMSIISELVAVIMAVLNAIRAFFDYLRNALGKLVNDIISRIKNSVIPVQTALTHGKGLMHSMGGMVAGIAYLGSGSVLTAFATVLWIIAIVLVILIIVGVFVGLMIVLAGVVYWAGVPFGWPGIALEVAILLAAIIPGIVLLAIVTPLYDFTTDVIHGVMSAHTRSAPAMPMCFDAQTEVALAGENARSTVMADLTPGDELRDGGTVTATFKLLARGQDMCKLGQVVLTGNHSVFHERKGWLAARDHPDAVPLPGYHPEYVHCINTSSKRIFLGSYTFADWDDLDESDFETLQHSSAPLPARFGPEDIHRSLTSGHAPGTKVRLADGSTMAIECVQPGTRLCGGECLGTVHLLHANKGIQHHLVTSSRRFRLMDGWTPHYDAIIESHLEEGHERKSDRELFI